MVQDLRHLVDSTAVCSTGRSVGTTAPRCPEKLTAELNTFHSLLQLSVARLEKVNIIIPIYQYLDCTYNHSCR